MVRLHVFPNLNTTRNCFLGFLLLFACVAYSAPRVVQQSAVLSSGDSSGNRIAAVTESRPYKTHIWERNTAGAWGRTAAIGFSTPDDLGGLPSIDISGNVIAVYFSQWGFLYIWEHNGTQWQASPLIRTISTAEYEENPIKVDQGRVYVGAAHEVRVYEKNSSGTWANTGSVHAGNTITDEHGEEYGTDTLFGVSGNHLIIAGLNAGPDDYRGYWFERSSTGAWSREFDLELPQNYGGKFGSTVAVDGDVITVSGETPIHGGVYTFLYSDDYQSEGYPYISFMGDGQNPNFSQNLGLVDASNNLSAVLANRYSLLGPDSVHVYDTSSGFAREIAELSQAATKPAEFRQVSVSGRTVVVKTNVGNVLVFDVPTDVSQPAIVDENFEDGSANGWQPHNVSLWSIASTANSKVYRQLDWNSASSVWSGIDWKDEAVEADATLTAVQGQDRWAGVATRYQDSNNYYYLSLRTSNQLQLRKKVNGAFTTLAAVSLPVQTNHTYRLRIEAVGTEIRGFVDGKIALTAVDSTFKHGSPALLSNGARVDFDNVRVTPNQLETFFSDAFDNSLGSTWVKVSGHWVDPPEFVPPSPDPYANQRNYSQTDTGGNAYTYNGAVANDQVVEAKVTADKFVSGGWVGLMARYAHYGDTFYYLRLASGQVALRKFVRGEFFNLASAPATFTNGTPYLARLEIVGTTLRGYINGRLVVQAQDTSIAGGKYGLATSKTAAKFDDFRVQRP
jgi:hypothetical protein